MSDDNTQTILDRLDQIEVEQEEFKQSLKGFGEDLKDLKSTIEVYVKLNDGYQKAADRGAAASERIGNLAFGVITASAAVIILAPAVKAVSEYFTR